MPDPPTACPGFYSVDLLVREHWYLATIDIMFDRGGFYLFWCVFVCTAPALTNTTLSCLGRLRHC